MPETLTGHTIAAQGQPVLDNNRPPDAADANDHGPRTPRRRTAARAATPTASTASPNMVCCGCNASSSRSRSCARTVNHTRISTTDAANLRNQPRTVDTGTQLHRRPPMAVTGRFRRERRADHRDLVTATQQRVFPDQHVRDPTLDTPRTSRTTTLLPTHAAHNTLTGRSPRAETTLTNRALQLACRQSAFDFHAVSSYDSHQCPSGHQEEPSRSLPSDTREGSYASDHAHAPTPPNQTTTIASLTQHVATEPAQPQSAWRSTRKPHMTRLFR